MIEQSILQTLAYFDIFEHPLTTEELYQALWKDESKTKFSDFIVELDSLAKAGVVQEHWGYYFLPGRVELVETRRRRTLIVERKMAIARRAVKKIRFVPFVEAVFVCNTVAAGHPDPASDIDVFIVIRHGRLWLSRLLATALLSLCGLRRHGKKITDRICLSFYITDAALNLESIALPPPDIYLVYWIAQLVPLYDPNGTLKKIHEANRWALHDAPHAFLDFVLRYDVRVEDTKASHAVKGIFEKMWRAQYGDLLESHAKGFQEARMKMRDKMRTEGASSHVIINDTMMKFHENDRRVEYWKKWEEKCQQFSL